MDLRFGGHCIADYRAIRISFTRIRNERIAIMRISSIRFDLFSTTEKLAIVKFC